VPCPGCSRHVKRGDAICPFCSANVSVESIPTRVLAGRLSRAALFAAGAVGVGIATTECAPSSVSEYGGMAPPLEQDSSASDDSSASYAPSGVAPDAADASATTGPTDSPSAPDICACPMYGAPAPPDE
jgi:hypothetical protein